MPYSPKRGDAPKYSESSRGNHRAFARKVYHSKAWKDIRNRAYVEGMATCAECGEPVQWEDFDCDHKEDIADRPDMAYDRENVRVLHRWCHSRKTGRGGRKTTSPKMRRSQNETGEWLEVT